MIEPPAFNFLSLGNGNSDRLSSSIVPHPLRRFANKKLYGRISNRHRSKLNKPSPSRSSNRQRLQKWHSIYSRAKRGSPARNSVSGRRLCNTQSWTETSPNRPELEASSFSLSSSLLPSTPARKSQWESNISLDENENGIGRDSQTPSPIRNSPSYGRRTRRRDDSSRNKSHATSPVREFQSNPQPSSNTETCVRFEKYDSAGKDDTTIDVELMEKLRSGPKGQRYNKTLGAIYVKTLELQEFNGYVKIGYTGRSMKSRDSDVSPKGKNGTVKDEVDVTPGAQSRFLNAYHAEQIVHLELHNHRYNLIDFDKGKEYVRTEWFMVDVDEAHRIIDKWRQWLIREKPYYDNGKLTEFWNMRISQKNSHDAYKKTRHKSLHERWNSLLNPTWWERTHYKLVVGWGIIWMCWTKHRLFSSFCLVIFSYFMLSTIWSLSLILLVLLVNGQLA
ncbi:hypothetical protein UA08_06456 [Talaromyces atroroseus]|uniref:Bacteriophage T5 Orf172 DNA-binding domain-containing protein n=1 Tax=Talaromyces atroroseus TaxID=1441469 RepID=A0A225AB99_TALAT|nr:hypothetical protein UA08_06456 [Talaromyces atroroseus]OKL58301.1 hypothetical protein UA08_06456 [Talaromyces atroroseus]